MLGLMIDKLGKRALFVSQSSVFVLLACVATILIPPASSASSPQYWCILPLILLGIGYSIFAAALWGCIPYTVPSRLVGTAFGLCTAVQNIGLTVSPMVSAALLEADRQGGYVSLMLYFSLLTVVGLGFNLWLYYDDLRNRKGILDAVDDGKNLAELMEAVYPRKEQSKGDQATSNDENSNNSTNNGK